jgi:hypothetical protein
VGSARGAEKRLLDKVGRIVGTADQAPGEAEQPLMVRVEERRHARGWIVVRVVAFNGRHNRHRLPVHTR